jgi:hypothetical protein
MYSLLPRVDQMPVGLPLNPATSVCQLRKKMQYGVLRDSDSARDFGGNQQKAAKLALILDAIVLKFLLDLVW